MTTYLMTYTPRSPRWMSILVRYIPYSSRAATVGLKQDERCIPCTMLGNDPCKTMS